MPAEKPKPTAEKFRMPGVAVGDTVLWTHDKTRLDSAVAALVTRVAPEAINLIFFPPDASRGTPRDGVRFHADPALDRIFSDAGVWDLAPMAKRVAALEGCFAHLEAHILKK